MVREKESFIEEDEYGDKLIRDIFRMTCRFTEEQFYGLGPKANRYTEHLGNIKYIILLKMAELIQREIDEHATFLAENQEVMERLKKGILSPANKPRKR